MDTDRDKLDQLEALNVTGAALIKEVKANQPPNVVAPLGPQFLKQTIVGTDKAVTLWTPPTGATIQDCTLTGSPQGQLRGIWLESVRDILIERTAITNIWGRGDPQCIAGNNGIHGLRVLACLLQASGENFILGGGDTVSDAEIPSDIEIADCTFSKDPAWMGRPDITSKNLFELKCARRVVLRDSTLDYSWNSGQVGFAIVLTVRNQNNRTPWSCIEDVRLQNLIVRHCAGGIQILGRDDTFPSGTLKRVTIDHVDVSDIDSVKWGKDANGNVTNGRIIQITNGSEDLQILNSRFTGPNVNSIFTFGVGTPPLAAPNVRLVVKDCFFDSGIYGIRGDDPDGAGPEQSLTGVKALERYCPGYVWSNVTVRKSANAQPCVYPPGTIFV